MKLEDNFKKLDETLEKLGEEDISLEDAFGLYKEGLELVKECNEQIDRVEKKLLVLSQDGEEAFEE